MRLPLRLAAWRPAYLNPVMRVIRWRWTNGLVALGVDVTGVGMLVLVAVIILGRHLRRTGGAKIVAVRFGVFDGCFAHRFLLISKKRLASTNRSRATFLLPVTG